MPRYDLRSPLFLCSRHVRFHPVPAAVQLRNPHDYVKDLAQETNMYRDTPSMLKNLNKWQCSATAPLDECMVQLQLYLHQKGNIGCRDVKLVEAWVRDLASIGYSMPSRRTSEPTKSGAHSELLESTCSTPAKLPAEFFASKREYSRAEVQALFEVVECGQGVTRGCKQTELPSDSVEKLK